MGFHDILKVEDDKFYIDVAFRKATEKAAQMRGGFISESNIGRSKQIESMKVKIVRTVLCEKLMDTLKSFPDIDDLHEFYRELIKATLDYGQLKKSLGAINWAHNQILAFGTTINHKINASSQPSVMNSQRREFYGRCSSILKQIRENFKILEHARRTILDFPNVRTGIPTIAIVGFPNVGKTTLLYKLTGSKAEIAPYAFTTKGVKDGYMNKDVKKKPKQEELAQSAVEREDKGRAKIQILDTPGTLNRPEKMNSIEKVAYLALTILANKAIYVFDLTEPYPLADQLELFDRVKKLKIPLMVYVSKIDLVPKDQYMEFAKKVGAITDIDEIKKRLMD